jgi:hypothetical protein
MLKLKRPPWLPWYGVLLLAAQILVALIFIGAVLADVSGLRPTAASNRYGPWFNVLVACWSALAIVASAGIWRGRSWGYFLEIGVLWMAMALPFANMSAPDRPALELSARGVLRIVALLYFSWILLLRGLDSTGKSAASKT